MIEENSDLGELIEETDARSVTVTRTVDALDRVARCDVGAFERVVAPEIEIPTSARSALALWRCCSPWRGSELRRCGRHGNDE